MVQYGGDGKTLISEVEKGGKRRGIEGAGVGSPRIRGGLRVIHSKE